MAAAVPFLLLGARAAVAGAAVKKAIGDRAQAPIVQQTAPAPTIDTARAAQTEAERIRRRRGVLANIFAGAAPGAAGPAVGTRTLLGGTQ